MDLKIFPVIKETGLECFGSIMFFPLLFCVLPFNAEDVMLYKTFQ